MKKVTRVKAGMQFRSVYADSNPLWEVVNRSGPSIWSCQIIDGADWEGTRKPFTSHEILQAMSHGQTIDTLIKRTNNFYESLKVGQVLHYENFGNCWVRCEVVKVDNGQALQAIALVGFWPQHELATRSLDGTIHKGYYVEKIEGGIWFQPSESNVYEWKFPNGDPRWTLQGSGPQDLQPLSWELPELTPAEQVRAEQWQRINGIRQLIADYKDAEPTALLKAIQVRVQTY
jgi:hypothetical protein